MNKKKLSDEYIIILLKDKVSINRICKLGVSFRRVKAIMNENNIHYKNKAGRNINGTNTKHTKLS